MSTWKRKLSVFIKEKYRRKCRFNLENGIRGRTKIWDKFKKCNNEGSDDCSAYFGCQEGSNVKH